MTIEYRFEELEQTAQKILSSFPDKKCFAFYAEMGSGKTTLIAALCRQLGVSDTVSSPTFAIINEYRTAAGHPIYHTDWYRLKGLEDAIEAGVEDILNKNATCFVEWPEIAEALLPTECLKIKISAIDDHRRKLEIV